MTGVVDLDLDDDTDGVGDEARLAPAELELDSSLAILGVGESTLSICIEAFEGVETMKRVIDSPALF